MAATSVRVQIGRRLYSLDFDEFISRLVDHDVRSGSPLDVTSLPEEIYRYEPHQKNYRPLQDRSTSFTI